MPRTLLLVLLLTPFAVAAPVPKPDPDAEVDGLLARVRIANLGGALSQPAIAKEIDLTDEQRKKLDKIGDHFAEQMKAKAAGLRASEKGQDEMYDVFSGLLDLSREFDEKAAEVLNPKQVRRLKQIQLQKEGPAALLSRHAIRALDPTAEQEEKLATALARSERWPLFEEQIATTDVTAEEAAMSKLLTKIANDVDAVNEAMLKVLTKEQRATWAKMTGDPLPRLQLLKAGTAFGDAKVLKVIEEADSTPAPSPLPPAQPPVVAPLPPAGKK